MRNKIKFHVIKNPVLYGIFFIAIVLSNNSVYSQALIKVVEAKKKFGVVSKGDKVDLIYKLVNEGKSPLLFQKFDVACSCTSVELPKQPTLPGDTALIKVSFDTKSVYDRQDRIVTIYSNNKNGEIKLRFKGFVKRH